MTNLYGISYNPYKKEINNLIYKRTKELKKLELIKKSKEKNSCVNVTKKPNMKPLNPEVIIKHTNN